MNDTTEPHNIAGLPFGLRWLGVPLEWSTDDSTLTITAGPRTDWFVDPTPQEGLASKPGPRRQLDAGDDDGTRLDMPRSPGLARPVNTRSGSGTGPAVQ